MFVSLKFVTPCFSFPTVFFFQIGSIKYVLHNLKLHDVAILNVARKFQ